MGMSPFLSPEDTIRLTGYKRAGEQAQWLKDHGIFYFINSKGKVVIPWQEKAVERKLELGPVE